MSAPTRSWRRLGAGLGLGGRVVRNSTYLFLANSSAKLLAFLLNVLIIWGLGDESFGNYRWVVAYVGIFANFVELGMMRVGVRAIARAPAQAEAVFAGLCRTKLILSVFSAAALVATTELFLREVAYFELIRLLTYFWFGAVMVHVLRKCHESVFLGLERMGWSALFVVGNRLVTLLLATLFVLVSKNIFGLLILFFCVDLLDLVLEYIAMRRLLRLDLAGIVAQHAAADADAARLSPGEAPPPPPEDYTRRTWIGWVRESLPFGLQELSAEVYMRIDTVMIGIILGSELAVADYNKAYLILTAVLVLPMAICQAVFPALSGLHRRAPAQVVPYFRHNYLMMVALGPTVMAGLVAFAPLLLRAMKGETHEVFLIYLVAMSSLPVYFLVMPMSYLLTAVYRQTFIMGVSIAMALFNIILNSMLIPDLGPIGAAWATLATEVFALLVLAIYLQRHFRGVFNVPGLLGLGAFHAAALAAGYALWDAGWVVRIAYLSVYTGLTLGVLAGLRMRSAPGNDGGEGGGGGGDDGGGDTGAAIGSEPVGAAGS